MGSFFCAKMLSELTFLFIIFPLQPSEILSDVDCTFATDCNTNADSPGTKYMVKVTCNEPPDAVPECVCEDKSPSTELVCADVGVDLTGVVFGNIEETCQTLCESMNQPEDIKCSFFKYEKHPSDPHKYCYLMNEDQCHEAPTGPCETDCHSGGLFCDGDHPAPTPGGGTCESDKIYHASEPTKNWLHWYCSITVNGETTPVSFSKGTFDANTKCRTHHPCYKFEEANTNILEYQCTIDLVADPSGDTASWVWVQGGETYNDQVLDDDGKLKEPECLAEDLVLDTSSYEQAGLLISCAGEPVSQSCSHNSEVCTYTVPAENECLLLCGMYPVLTFFPDWTNDKDGNRIWYYKNQQTGDPQVPLVIDDDNDPNSVKNIIKCWETL